MHGSGSGPCSSWSTATCAARWLTPYSGFPSPTASAFAAATPTSSAPASPGPLVTAIASTSCNAIPAVAQARSTVGTIASRWARDATSGTTPPKRACSSTLEATASASRVWPRTTPTPVSSQEVSMPRTSGSCVMPGILLLDPDAENGGMVQEVAPQELLATTTIPFVRHQVDPGVTRHAWVLGDAVVVDGARGRPGDVMLGPVYTCLGPPEDLTPLMAYVDRVGRRPWRATVELPGEPPWHRPESHDWHWMLTQGPVQQDTRWDVAVLGEEDDAAIDELLDEANPGSFARPGSPGLDAWLGVRDGDRVIGAGAGPRTHDGAGDPRGGGGVPAPPPQGGGGAPSPAPAAAPPPPGRGAAP